MDGPVLSSGDTPGSLYDGIARHAAQHPQRVAISQRGRDGHYQLTRYRELLALIQGFARLFDERLPRQAILPVLMGRSAHSCAAMLGAVASGRAFASLNPKLKPPQIAAVLSATGARGVLVDGQGVMALRSGAAEEPSFADTRWWWLRQASDQEIHEQVAAGLRERLALEDVAPVAGGDAEADPYAGRGADAAPACVLFTSGSTGASKGVLIGGRDLYARAHAEVAWYGIEPHDVLLNLLPFAFDVGLNQLLSAVAAGCELVILDSWLPADILNAAADRRVSGISAVPAIWQDMLKHGARFDTEGRHAALRYVTVSGGDLGPAQLEKLPSVAEGVGIFKTYGQTEAFRAASLRPEEFERHTASVGRAFPGAEVRVVREDGSDCAPGEVGEVVHAGLGVMLGYLDGADPQAKLRGSEIHTGDLGMLTEDGYLYLRGRRDQMVKISGNRVYPAELSHALVAERDVAEAEVVAVADEAGTMQLVAFVVPRSEGLDARALRLRLARRVPSYMVPVRLVLRGELPRLATGKPDLGALRALAEESLREAG